MSAVISTSNILEKWEGRYIEYGTDRFSAFRSDLNLLLVARDRLKPVYQSNAEGYNCLQGIIKKLAAQVFLPKYVL